MRERTSKLLIRASLAMSGAAITLNALVLGDMLRDESNVGRYSEGRIPATYNGRAVSTDEFYIFRNESAKPNELPFFYIRNKSSYKVY